MTAAWNRYVLECRERYGVGTMALARDVGVPPSSFYRRCEIEGWVERYPGVFVAPWVEPTAHTELSALMHAVRTGAAACGQTAAWLYDLRDAPPRRLEIAVPHHVRPHRAIADHVRRARWLADDDRAVVRRLPTLTPEATIVSLADLPPTQLRALIIDVQHRRLTGVSELGARPADVGPVRGRHRLVRLLYELADRRAESVFHDLVLDELDRRGYRPARQPLRLETPDGRGVTPDIPLPDWQIALEVQGDRFHRSRSQRAADRRKVSQYAGTGWLVLELDWSEWMGQRDHFLAALDAAILAQVRNGVAGHSSLPAHLRGLPPAGE